MRAPWLPLLDWWFGPAESPTEVVKARNTLWFGKKQANDAEARERFGDLVDKALAGGLAEWAENPKGWLALILLLDQLPRMIHRDTPNAFAGDPRAQALVKHGLKLERDQHLDPLQRTFIYLVLEHSENLADQNQAIACFTRLLPLLPSTDRDYFTSSLDFAERHQAIIARFGRFPHRNAILGRTSTDQEIEFLEKPGSSF
ncbi:Uncharacterized conserved protein, DUF924 family [Pseudomonas asturiensis]|uniref:Uncharacterized conserved protein, DUF924 family n=1 Tax=Pseudomonas asturiensis TaxID=1190415 RepID=A0A1M7PFN6_9PSED|nr:DUF924 family protein [Pseudomonas asturiensis]SHN15797.1 Uncharacterized conserved protein, DUF924 family [Pseudomonas asturiensis]